MLCINQYRVIRLNSLNWKAQATKENIREHECTRWFDGQWFWFSLLSRRLESSHYQFSIKYIY